MSGTQDRIDASMVDGGTIVRVDNVRHNRWGDNMGGPVHFDVECLPWMINAIQGYLADGRPRQQSFARDNLKIAPSGSDLQPRMAIESERDGNAPHGGITMESMDPALGANLLAQLEAISGGAQPASDHTQSSLDWLFARDCPQCGEQAGWTGQVEEVWGDVALVMGCPHCQNAFNWANGKMQAQLRIAIPHFVAGRRPS